MFVCQERCDRSAGVSWGVSQRVLQEGDDECGEGTEQGGFCVRNALLICLSSAVLVVLTDIATAPCTRGEAVVLPVAVRFAMLLRLWIII